MAAMIFTNCHHCQSIAAHGNVIRHSLDAIHLKEDANRSAHAISATGIKAQSALMELRINSARSL